MKTFILRRLLLVPIQLFGLTVLIFAGLMLISPEERASLYITNTAKGGKQIEVIIRHYELDAPMYKQYWNWLVGKEDMRTGEINGGILRGNLGYSRSGAGKVDEMIRERFAATLELTLLSFFPILLTGLLIGVQAALNHNKFFDQVLRISSIIASSFPAFVLGLILIIIFYVKLDWLQIGRYSPWVMLEIIEGNFVPKTGLFLLDSLLAERWDIFLDLVKHLVMPMVTLPYVSWAIFVRVTRSSMLETMGQDYLVTARAKGLSEKQIIRKHAVPNALMPVTTLGAQTLISLLSGVVITEAIFNFPGMGLAAARASTKLDVITILGFSLFNGVILILIYLLVDIIYCIVDPRVRID